MHTFKKHKDEHLDNTRGKWRPALTAGIIGADGHPASFNEIVVFSCPSCGAPQGVGGDDVKIQADGTTDGPVKCYHCGWTEVLHFELHADAVGRDHFGKLKEDAKVEVAEARMSKIKQLIREQMQQELDAKAHEAAKQILPDGDPNHAELFKNYMKNKKQ